MARDSEPFELRTGGAFAYLEGWDVAARLQGRQLGDYRIHALLGIGGMALVFRGARADQAFERDVAIKILPGVIAQPRLRQQFLEERKILARLNHPNIAQLYDAGETREGWPYIVMELIEGQTMDGYCRARGLSIAERVALVRNVARAAAFAHEHRIIHRDIKPSNVLIDATGRPKLVDFGIAKLTTDHATLTQTDVRMFTPLYASPEQLLDEPVTPRSDVYQLGLLLHEVLSGERPFPEASAVEIIQRARERRRPTIRHRHLPRALRAVITCCLQPDVDRRYADAHRLADDLDCYLSSYPVKAGAFGAFDHLRYWMLRNRLAAATAMIGAVAVVATSVWYTERLNDARARAEIRAQANQHLLDAMTQFLANSYRGVAGVDGVQLFDDDGAPNARLEQLLVQNEALIDTELRDHPVERAELLRMMARRNRELGRYRHDRQLLEEALAVATEHGDPELEAMLYVDLVRNALAGDDHDDLDAGLERALTFVSATQPGSRLEAEARVVAAMVAIELSRLDDALHELDRVRDLVRRLPEEHTDILADVYRLYASVYTRWRDPDNAILWGERAILHLSSATPRDERRLAQVHGAVGWSYLALGKFERSEQHLKRQLAACEAIYGPRHPQVARALNNLGWLDVKRGRYDSAESLLERSLSTVADTLGLNSTLAVAVMMNLATLYEHRGRFAEAVDTQQRAVTIAASLGEAGARLHAHSLHNLGISLAKLGHLERAREVLGAARGANEALQGAETVDSAQTELALVKTLSALGELAEARRLLDHARSVYLAEYGEQHGNLDLVWEAEGRYWLARGRPENAVRFFERYQSIQASTHGAAHSKTARAWLHLAETHLALERTADARLALEGVKPWLRTANPTHPQALKAALLGLRVGGTAETEPGRAERLRVLVAEHFPAREDLQQLLP